MRPHQHVFQGLDSSAFRLMEKAFEAGRPFHSVDSVLSNVPAPLRCWTTLLGDGVERNTRDRSFQIMSLDTCETQPFFYPLLPLCMLGFDALVPGAAGDYFVPFLSLLCVVAFLSVGAVEGGAMGVLLVLALVVGSPLPSWLMRGCYLETVSGLLVAMSVLVWQRERSGHLCAVFRYAALALAVSFHPSMLVLAIPAAGLMLLTESRGVGRVVVAALSLVVGLAPLWLMTQYVTAPYGAITVDNLVYMFRASASVRAALFGAILAGMAVLVIVPLRPRLRECFVWAEGVGRGVLLACLLTFVALSPTILAVVCWSQAAFVRQGLWELFDGLQIPFGILISVVGLHMLWGRRSGKLRLLLTTVLMALPVFLYLKGNESMGLWSQRRLIAPLLIVIACCIPLSAARLALLLQGRGNIFRCLAAVTMLVLAGGWNAYHWPAPYGVRYEYGADRWVDDVAKRIGARLAFFDNYALSVPLVARPDCRAVGLSDFGFEGYGGLADWLGQKAATDAVVVVTLYRNPGMEQGVRLVSEARSEVTLKRARSKTSLPAIKERLKLGAEFLRAEPVVAGHLPIMDKVFDPGPLGLRPPWGRSDISISVAGEPDREARWSRQGSGIVGPVPAPGGTVHLHVEATASRGDGRDSQVLRILPPWDGAALEMTISNGFTVVEGAMVRPADDDSPRPLTGVYRILSAYPYDPSKQGIRKFDPDLGALIHRMRIDASVR